jgi:hypothetical protein
MDATKIHANVPTARAAASANTSSAIGDAICWTKSTKPDRLIIVCHMAVDLDQEAAFIRAFIVPAKQERLVELLGKAKRRQDVLRTLYHFADLDPRFISRIPAAEDGAEGIEALLRSKGAPDLCYAISTDQGLDDTASSPWVQVPISSRPAANRICASRPIRQRLRQRGTADRAVTTTVIA